MLNLNCQAKPLAWQTLAPGLEYTTLIFSQSYAKLHAFRIDPTLYQFNILLAKDMQRKAGLISSFAQTNDALLAINGGFFDPDYRSLGLRIDQGKVLNPLKPISWWSIFTLQKQEPKIIEAADYNPANCYDFAIQAGPRLLHNGKISTLADKPASRSALCINTNNQVIIVVTEHLKISMSELAEMLSLPEQQGGLDCKDALNLDGGHSSQFYGRIAQRVIQVPNFSPVADAITVKAMPKPQ